MTTILAGAIAPLPTSTPFGYGAGAMIPLAHARWIRTHAVDRIEEIPGGSLRTVRLHSGTEHLDTHAVRSLWVLGTTIDGEPSLVGLDATVISSIDPIIEWERQHPHERPFGVGPVSLSRMVEAIEHHILMGPEGIALLVEIDREMAKGRSIPAIHALRKLLRTDPHDLQNVSGHVHGAVRALAEAGI